MSENRSQMTLKASVASSMGYVRDFLNNSKEVELMNMEFYSAFGGLNGSIGATVYESRYFSMMYQQDYIMRIISNLIKFLSRIVFGKDKASYELSGEEKFKESDQLHNSLLDLLSKGKVNQAENLLFEKFNPEDKGKIMVAIDFYQRLNNLDDSFLKENNFSREEIEEGLKDIANKAGIITYKL